MKRNLNSRKISIIKNTLFQKELRRKKKLKEREKTLGSDFNNEEEMSLLFPDLKKNNEKIGNIQCTMENEEKNIFLVKAPADLYQKDLLEELTKYKDAPMHGFRKGSINMTLLDFRYGSQIRDSLVQNKYTDEAVKIIIEMKPELKEKAQFHSAFNVKRDKECSFNIVFYGKDADVNKDVADFMENKQKEELKNTEENSSSTETNTKEEKTKTTKTKSKKE